MVGASKVEAYKRRARIGRIIIFSGAAICCSVMVLATWFSFAALVGIFAVGIVVVFLGTTYYSRTSNCPGCNVLLERFPEFQEDPVLMGLARRCPVCSVEINR
jgi:Flp pilus assembly protein TadB